LELGTRIIEVRAASEFSTAFALATRENLHALHIPIAPLFIGRRAELVALAAQSRIPVVYGIREFVTAGGLMSYGTSLADIYRRKARMVHEILTGANPATLPIERPTKFEFVINQKTASELGLPLSPALIALADEVIE
jgi:putative tryptophan/tyrosine transport system substrate-binding protein